MTTDNKSVVILLSLANPDAALVRAIMCSPVVCGLSVQAPGKSEIALQTVGVRWAAAGSSGHGDQVAPKIISRFEAMPAELRNAIYELALVQPDSVTPAQKPHASEIWILEPGRKSHMLALTTVSRQMRSESLSLLFLVNNFRLVSGGVSGGTLFTNEKQLQSQLASLDRWLQTVGIQGARSISSLSIDVSGWFS
ncbi:hypothetical protein LTR36_010891 [Oleoguttula mirabilis]|uniref:Uncharacterized protein n=1 Tax=Oleoguttula mirabilis TaxID=1507867 RepID=A0AAV9J3N5_9PEZI|nr:hypothetical protein LTR36_010891 [Oleoguttula mirabilis]